MSFFPGIRSDINLVFILEKFFQDVPPLDSEFRSTCVSSPCDLPNAKATDLKRKRREKKKVAMHKKLSITDKRNRSCCLEYATKVKTLIFELIKSF